MVYASYGTWAPAPEDVNSNGFGRHDHHQEKDSKRGCINFFTFKLERVFLLINILLEILLLIFDKMASPTKPKYGLIVWELSLGVMLVCIVELVHRGLVKERLTLLQCLKSLIPCSSEKKPYSFMDGLILVGAKVQMALASIAYGYLRKGKENPINVSLVSIIFIVCFVIYKIVKNYRNRTNALPVRQDN